VERVLEDAVDEGFVDEGGAGGEGEEERVVAKAVDDAGGAAGEMSDAGDGFRGKKGFSPTFRGGDLEAVQDVVGDFVERQRSEVVGQSDPLAKLFEVRLGDFVAKLGLADEDDLDQFFARGFEVGKHAKFFEDLVGKVLSFVNDDDDEAVLGELMNEELVEGDEHGGFVGVGRMGWGVGELDGKFVAEESDELRTVEVSVANESELGVVFESSDEHVCEECFAGADVAGEEDETAALLDGVNKTGERFVVTWRFEKEVGVGRVAEREVLEVVMAEVHGGNTGEEGEVDGNEGKLKVTKLKVKRKGDAHSPPFNF